MPPITLNARILSSGVRALYLGPAFDLAAHRTSVAVLCCDVSGSMEVARDPLQPEGDWVACRTLFVPAGTLHRVRSSAQAIACVYLDPQGADVARQAAAMTCRHDGFATHHRREDEICALVTAVVCSQMEPAHMHARLAVVCNFSPAPATDERIAKVIARMRGAPGDTHSLTALAAEVGLSPSRLQHLFKACTGLPLRRFRIWNRMGAAIAAVSAGASLTVAAHRAGFSSSAHFSTAFRAMFGLCPSDLVAAGLRRHSH